MQAATSLVKSQSRSCAIHWPKFLARTTSGEYSFNAFVNRCFRGLHLGLTRSACLHYTARLSPPMPQLSSPPASLVCREFAVCQYEIVMKSKYGCGCEPDCYEKNCGGDGCRGYCGGAGNRGRCPDGFDCTDDGQCCKPDCTNRYCGDDGCGGSCGDCDTGMNCTRYQQCAPDPRLVSPSQQPAQFAPVTVPTSTSGDYAASFIGGIISAGVVTVGMTWFFKIRAAVAASGGGYGRL